MKLIMPAYGTVAFVGHVRCVCCHPSMLRPVRLCLGHVWGALLVRYFRRVCKEIGNNFIFLRKRLKDFNISGSRPCPCRYGGSVTRSKVWTFCTPQEVVHGVIRYWAYHRNHIRGSGFTTVSARIDLQGGRFRPGAKACLGG